MCKKTPVTGDLASPNIANNYKKYLDKLYLGDCKSKI